MVIAELYALCKSRGDLTFDNDEVKGVCSKIGFGNPFDATKWDNSGALPKALVDDDVFVVHLGKGRHQFVSGMRLDTMRSSASPQSVNTNGLIAAVY